MQPLKTTQCMNIHSRHCAAKEEKQLQHNEQITSQPIHQKQMHQHILPLLKGLLATVRTQPPFGDSFDKLHQDACHANMLG